MKVMKGFMIVFAVIVGMLFVTGCGAAPGNPAGEKLSVTIQTGDQNLTTYSNQTLKFDLNVTGGTKPYFYEWAENGEVLDTNATLSYIIGDGTPLGKHTIAAKVSDSENEEVNATVSFTVISAPNPAKELTEAVVGIDLEPGQAAARGSDGKMHKGAEKCPRNVVNGSVVFYQSDLDNHWEYYTDTLGDPYLIRCSANSPVKVEINGKIRDDFTALRLTDDRETAAVDCGGTKEDNGKIDIYCTSGLAWSVSQNQNVKDAFGGEYRIERVTNGDITNFKSYFNGVLETESNSTRGSGITWFKEYR